MEGDNHFLIMGQVVVGKKAATTVFDPFLGNLVATNIEGPDYRGNSFEILAWVNVNAVVVFDIPGITAFDVIVARHRIMSDEIG